MKNGCCVTACEVRYVSAPSLPSCPSPLSFMYRPSLFCEPPPAWSGSWLAPASGGFQREKPYLARSAGTNSEPAGLLQCHLPLYTALKPAADITVAIFLRCTGSSTWG